MRVLQVCNSGTGRIAKAGCVVAYEICNSAFLVPYEQTGLNPYDMRVKCAKPPLCYDFSGVGKFLERPEVRTALNIRTDAGEWHRGLAPAGRLDMGDD